MDVRAVCSTPSRPAAQAQQRRPRLVRHVDVERGAAGDLVAQPTTTPSSTAMAPPGAQVGTGVFSLNEKGTLVGRVRD
jgi:hypothetical protein